MEQKVGEIFKDDAKKAREILNLSIQVVFFFKISQGNTFNKSNVEKKFSMKYREKKKIDILIWRLSVFTE